MRIPLTLATLRTVMILVLCPGCSRKTPAASYDLLNQTCARDTYQLGDRDKIKDLIDRSYPDAEKNAGYITAADGSMIQVEAGKDIQPEATEDQWILIVTIMGQ